MIFPQGKPQHEFLFPTWNVAPQTHAYTVSHRKENSKCNLFNISAVSPWYRDWMEIRWTRSWLFSWEEPGILTMYFLRVSWDVPNVMSQTVTDQSLQSKVYDLNINSNSPKTKCFDLCCPFNLIAAFLLDFNSCLICISGIESEEKTLRQSWFFDAKRNVTENIKRMDDESHICNDKAILRSV